MGRLLVIGAHALHEEVMRALPRCEMVTAEHPLEGLWQAGQHAVDGILLSLSGGRNPLSAVRHLRTIAPRARLVVACQPADEPAAQQAVREGADEYVLEPLTRAELERAFRLPSLDLMSRPPRAAPAQPWAEPAQLAELLRGVAAGPQALLERLATMLQQTLAARGVLIALDDLIATAGAVDDPVLEEAVLREGQPVGKMVIGRRTEGNYTATTLAALSGLGDVIDAAVAQARECQRWRELAWTDDLSGLRNRRFFDSSLDDLIVRATEQRSRITVLFFDIDNFKSYNDRYGYETGDALIRELGELLTYCTRDGDVVCRYGGDEFAVIFWDAEEPRVSGSKHPTDVLALVERFQRAIGAHDFKCLGLQAPGPVTISGGLATFPWNGMTRAELLRAADAASRSAKDSGKNTIVLAGEEYATEGGA